MHNYNTTEIDRITNSTTQERQTLTVWFAQQGEQTKLEAFKLQGDLAQQLRPDYSKENRTEFYFAMFILALNKMRWIETAQRQKQALTQAQAQQITDVRIARIKAKRKQKTSPQRELIRIRFYEEIRQLRSQGLSWRETAEYIAKHHKKKFSHGYLQQCFDDLTTSRAQAEGATDGD